MNQERKKLNISTIVFWLAILSLIASIFYYNSVYKTGDIEKVLPEVIPEATRFETISSNPLTFRAYKNSEVVGYAALGKATGYQSIIEMLVSVDLDGKVSSATVFKQSETLVFFDKLINQEFFSQFLDKDIRDGFILEENIDAVSGATVSSLAVTKAVNKATVHIGKNELNIETIEDPYKEFVFGYKELFLLLILAFSVLSIYLNTKKIRYLVLLFTVIVIGFMQGIFITNSFFATLFVGQIPSFENIYWWILMPLIILIVFFTGKNIFFNWICPFGAFQELLSRFVGIKGFQPSPKIEKLARKLPALLTWLALVLAFMYGNPNIATYEPFASFFSQIGTSLHWLLLVIVVFSSFIVKRFWCRYFCPVGYIMFFISRLKRKGVRLWKRVKNGKITSS